MAPVFSKGKPQLGGVQWRRCSGFARGSSRTPYFLSSSRRSTSSPRRSFGFRSISNPAVSAGELSPWQSSWIGMPRSSAPSDLSPCRKVRLSPDRLDRRQHTSCRLRRIWGCLGWSLPLRSRTMARNPQRPSPRSLSPETHDPGVALTEHSTQDVTGHR